MIMSSIISLTINNRHIIVRQRYCETSQLLKKIIKSIILMVMIINKLKAR
jgi:hypothetical protein